ncbi:MAG: hypothetical protein RMY16_17380 [Nostoc sp. DedQUE12b]|uniref:hypothetical protein n=1 Tax=Nostoc sp. DedQUE12b TaxID=3075398 RepID=UPI002AD279FC|nr:hypothetical protein [Nostoc sp. DedQUE12b]MDZ8087308.1 hypothetical protein [Nostoc sp. DedQUE12b]
MLFHCDSAANSGGSKQQPIRIPSRRLGTFSAKVLSREIEQRVIPESTIKLISGLGSAEKIRIVQISQSSVYFCL